MSGRRTPAHRIVFDRIAAFGLTSVLEPHADNTYATCVRESRPIPYRQLDYLFVPRGAAVRGAEILNGAHLRAASDHLPVAATLGELA